MPREWDTVAGLCVGTTKVSVIVAEVDPRYQSQDSIHVIGIGNAPSRGLSKGVITNLTEATDSVRKAFNEAANITNKRIDSAIVAFNALDVRSITTSGMVALENRGGESTPRRVEEADIKRAITAAKSRLDQPNSMIAVHTIPVNYALDGRMVDEPLNMTGTRLDIMLQTVSVPQSYVQNFITCVQNAGIRVDGLVLKPLAAALGSLEEDEMRAGCISVSIGGGSTGMVLYQSGKPFKIMSVPIGGNHITSDLASVLRISMRDAEYLKRRIFTESEENLKQDGIDIDLALKVIGSRIEELFMEYIRVSLSECSPQLFPGGIVLSGGVAEMPDVDTWLSDIMQMQVRKAKPVYRMPPGYDDGSYVGAAGLLRFKSYKKRNQFMFIEPSFMESNNNNRNINNDYENDYDNYYNDGGEGGIAGVEGMTDKLGNTLTNLMERFKGLFLD